MQHKHIYAYKKSHSGKQIHGGFLHRRITALFVAAIVFTSFHTQVQGQEPLADTMQHQSVVIGSKSTAEGLMIRWAPADVDAWLAGNTNGYRLERLEVGGREEGFMPIGKGTYKPWPLEDWKSVVSKQRPYVAAAAMTIYGEDKSTEEKGFVTAAADLENRYGMAMLAADLDRKAAEASGLYYADGDVKKDVIYIYRVYISNQEGMPLSDTAYMTAVLTEPEELKSPEIADITGGDRIASISWDRPLPGTGYSGYYIERKATGMSWERITKTPFLDFTTELMKDKHFITYQDSLPQNGIPYEYRLIAIDNFGDQAIPSEPVTVLGKANAEPPTGMEVTQEGMDALRLSWQYPPGIQVKAFRIYRAVHLQGSPLLLDEVAGNIREYLDTSPEKIVTNYYFVSAVNTYDIESPMVAAFGFVKDRTPPMPPVNLRSRIDQKGRLTLEWDRNPESDIRGYLVYYSNTEEGPYAVIPGDYLKDPVYSDTLEVRTLTENIYYYVAAIDYSYNFSDNSELHKVKKPDLVPPTPSIFVNYLVEMEKISVMWEKSSSLDVMDIRLMRKSGDGAWSEVEDFDENKPLYVDSHVAEGITYEYRLDTEDDDGHITPSPTTLRVMAKKSHFLKETPTLQVEKGEKTISLHIRYNAGDAATYSIYRGIADGPVSMYKKVSSPSFEDNFVRRDTAYRYAVEVNGRDGRSSLMSEEVVVEY